MEEEQSYSYVIRQICIRCGCEPVDPWQREKVIYKGTEPDWRIKVPPADFVRRDLEDIENCDVSIAYLLRLSAGTCMELFYAEPEGKRRVCICPTENLNPWIIVHSDMILESIEELERVLKRDS